MSMKDKLRQIREKRDNGKKEPAETPKVVRLPVKPRPDPLQAAVPDKTEEKPARDKSAEADSVGDMLDQAFEAEAARAVVTDEPESPKDSVADMLAEAIRERAEAKKKALQGPEVEGDQEEVEAEEVEPIECLEGTVTRIFLGKLKAESPIMTPEDRPWVFTLGTKPKKAGRGYLKEVGSEPETDEISGDSIYEQVTATIPELRRHSIDLEEGPYADHEGLVEAFSEEVFKDAKMLSDMVERVIDIVRPLVDEHIESIFPRIFESESYSFRYNEHFADLPDELPTAGRILGQSSRLVTDPSSKAKYVMVADMLEPYLLSVSLLRRMNVNAYPAFGVVPGPPEQFTPLVTIIDDKSQVPLTTFSLLRKHPPIGSVELISDQAMLAATHCMLAKYRTKHLTVEMVQQSKVQLSLGPDEVENQVHRIGDNLVEAHRRWPGTHLISEALNFLYQDIGEATVAMMMDEMQLNQEQLALMHPELQVPGVMEAQLQESAAIAGNRFREMALSRLERVMPKHPAKEENES
jgi:hypothetical protein